MSELQAAAKYGPAKPPSNNNREGERQNRLTKTQEPETEYPLLEKVAELWAPCTSSELSSVVFRTAKVERRIAQPLLKMA
jgi:hypothetical protein